MQQKKLIASAVVVAVLGAGYVATAWGLGRLTHDRFTTWVQKVNEKGAGLVKVVGRESTSGLFFSREDVTFELDTKAFDKFKNKKSNAEEVDEADEEGEPTLSGASLRVAEAQEPQHAIRFTVRNDIAHGPFPGFASLGIARISSRFLLDEQTRRDVAKVFGDKDPMLITSLVGFGGAGRVDVTSPAIVKAGDETIQWQGFTAHFAFARDMQKITCEGKAPGLLTHGKDASDVKIGAIGFSCDLNRAFDDLYVGRSSFGIDGMSANLGEGKSPFSMDSIAYSGNASIDGDFVDVNFKLLVKGMKAAEFSMNEAEYNLSFKHLHGPTYAALTRKISDLSTSGALGDPTASIAMAGAIAEFGPKLLEYSPQLVVERIGFSMPEGEAGLKGIIQLKDFSKEDLATANVSAVLLKKVQADIDLWVDEGLLQRNWSQPGVETTSGATTADRIHAVQAQVSSLEQRGFIKREDDRLISHIAFSHGALTANGQPVGPAGSN